MNKKLSQRVSNFKNSYVLFLDVLDDYKSDKKRNTNRMALIHSFETTFELSWKVIKDYLFYFESLELISPREVFMRAFNFGIIKDKDLWSMIHRARNSTVHVYDQKVADEILGQIENVFVQAFEDLKNEIESRLK